jgi:uncharacterized membrane protein
MDINDLKADWKNAGGSSINEANLKIMTKINEHPTLRNIRIKLIIEAIALIILLLIYYDGFDGAKKPWFLNLSLVFSILIYITNNVLGYFFTKNPIRADNISLSIHNQILVLRRLSVFSILSSVFYASTLIMFFSVSIKFTTIKYFLLACVILIFAIMFYFSYKKWQTKIDHFSHLLSGYLNDIA